MDRHGLLPDLFHGLTTDLRSSLKDILDAGTIDRARQNGVGANAVFTEFDGQRFGETDQSPFRRAVRASVGIPKSTGN